MVLAETLALRLPSLSVLVTWAPNIIFLFFTFYQVKRGLKV
jgi:hypothetical protein